jgi:hypothetical protein
MGARIGGCGGNGVDCCESRRFDQIRTTFRQRPLSRGPNVLTWRCICQLLYLRLSLEPGNERQRSRQKVRRRVQGLRCLVLTYTPLDGPREPSSGFRKTAVPILCCKMHLHAIIMRNR